MLMDSVARVQGVVSETVRSLRILDLTCLYQTEVAAAVFSTLRLEVH